MLKIGALWRGRDGGKASATGQVSLVAGASLVIPDGMRLVLMPNQDTTRQAGKHPDWFLYLAPDDDQNESTPPGNPGSAL